MIRRTDRISAVLKRDETLVDVFTAVSPVFERLRNPAMRKVMTRLVTVEQAARIAGVDADALLNRLNEGHAMDTDVAGAEEVRNVAPDAAIAAPAALLAIVPEKRVEVDVRDDLRQGREPFSRIMAAKASVPAGGALSVRAIFEPVPLYAVMAKQGYDHFTEQLADDDWRVWFYPDAGASTPAASSMAASRTPASGTSVPAASHDASGEDLAVDANVVVLDVRGLEPPEPMMRTLGALESLPEGGTLVQINVRVPQFLLPQLEQRGFMYEVREQEPGLVRVFIRRGAR